VVNILINILMKQNITAIFSRFSWLKAKSFGAESIISRNGSDVRRKKST